jgi:hypothetical protein
MKRAFILSLSWQKNLRLIARSLLKEEKKKRLYVLCRQFFACIVVVDVSKIGVKFFHLSVNVNQFLFVLPANRLILSIFSSAHTLFSNRIDVVFTKSVVTFSPAIR